MNKKLIISEIFTIFFRFFPINVDLVAMLLGCVIIKFMEKYAVWGIEIMDNQYFVGWGTLALINAALAQGKNRTGLNWFLLSLVLGPLATLILLFVEKRQ